MLRRLTLDLPEDLLRRAEARAAARGTTLASLIRGHLIGLTGHRSDEIDHHEILADFSEGRRPKEEAIAALDLRDHSDLLYALGDAGFPPPRLPERRIAAMTEEVLRLLGRDQVNSSRAVIVIPDPGPIDSLWNAGRLYLLNALGVPVIIPGAVRDALTARATSDLKHFQLSRAFGELAGLRVIDAEAHDGRRPRRAGDRAPASGNGVLEAEDVRAFLEEVLRRHAPRDDAGVLLLLEDADLGASRFAADHPRVRPVSTVALLRGLERMRFLQSADHVIAAMTTPSHPTKRHRHPHPPAGEQARGIAEDGAAEDGAAEDGAAEDGAAEDGANAPGSSLARRRIR